jgi:hypothetical protein
MWVRVASLLVVILGALLFLNAVLDWNIASSGKGVLSVFHLFSALALVGLYEAVLARGKRGGGNPGQVSLFARIALTATLALGLYILLGNIISLFDNQAYKTAIWIHMPLGLISIGVAEMALGRLKRSAN